MKTMRTSKKMMYDDIFISIVFIVVGIFGFSSEHPYDSVLSIVFGVLWLGIRLFHLTHQSEVLGDDA